MEKVFNRIMATIALGVIVWFAYLEKSVHRAVYGILAGVIFQATKEDILTAIKLFKGITLEEKGKK